MKIAYGTYATPMLPLDEALRMIADIGYDGVELCISPKHSSMPEELDSAKRRQLRDMLSELNLGVPALFMTGSVLTEDEEAHKERLELTSQVMELARDLGIGDHPVISVGAGGRTAMWETHRDLLVRLLGDYAELASEEGFTLAIEAHANAMVDRSERVIWVLDTVDNPLIKLHFDIVHLYLAREPITETVHKLVPYTAHTHITDARILEDRFELLLLGDGELDSVEYVKAMHEAGWDDFITLEVSTMVWSKEDYDPYAAASFSYNTLNNAFKAAGVPRTR
ncbi:sugar phosphate isomerase/epimerase family protein [Candidatus Poribacteria bacterium]